jgi:hypothetical protein
MRRWTYFVDAREHVNSNEGCVVRAAVSILHDQIIIGVGARPRVEVGEEFELSSTNIPKDKRPLTYY